MFENVIGHENIKQRLNKCIETNTCLNAYIFSGFKGIGKKTMAYDFALAITDNTKEDIFVVTNENYRYKVSVKNKKTDALSVDVVRKAREEMYIKPYGKKKVFIFPDGDNMNEECQNALLKVFEEPPDYCVIIIVSVNDKALLQTIRSRAVSVKFAPLTQDDIKLYFEKNSIPCDEAILTISNGSIENAVKITSDTELKEIIAQLINHINKLTNKKRTDYYAFENFLQANKARGMEILDIMLIIFEHSMLPFSEKNGTMHIKGIDLPALAKITELIFNTRAACDANGNYTIFVSELLLDIWEAIND